MANPLDANRLPEPLSPLPPGEQRLAQVLLRPARWAVNDDVPPATSLTARLTMAFGPAALALKSHTSTSSTGLDRDAQALAEAATQRVQKSLTPVVLSDRYRRLLVVLSSAAQERDVVTRMVAQTSDHKRRRLVEHALKTTPERPVVRHELYALAWQPTPGVLEHALLDVAPEANRTSKPTGSRSDVKAADSSLYFSQNTMRGNRSPLWCAEEQVFAVVPADLGHTSSPGRAAGNVTSLPVQPTTQAQLQTPSRKRRTSTTTASPPAPFATLAAGPGSSLMSYLALRGTISKGDGPPPSKRPTGEQPRHATAATASANLTTGSAQKEAEIDALPEPTTMLCSSMIAERPALVSFLERYVGIVDVCFVRQVCKVD